MSKEFSKIIVYLKVLFIGIDKQFVMPLRQDGKAFLDD